MVNGLIGIKKGMTQIFKDDGTLVPVTLLEVGPCVVTQVKTRDKDGYDSVQMGLVSPGKVKGVTKPRKGHFEKAGVPATKILREFEIADEKAELKAGDRFSVDIFKDVKTVDITGTSKGKGFQGVMKRWGFHGGKATHGSMFHRAPGSIGAAADPSRVYKGTKMPGQYGNEKITVKRLNVVEIDEEKNLMAVKGAVPGAKNGYVFVRISDK